MAHQNSRTPRNCPQYSGISWTDVWRWMWKKEDQPKNCYSIPSWNWPNLCPAWRHWSWQPKKQWRVTANILPQPSSFFVCLYFTNLYNIWNCYTSGGREGVFVRVGNVGKREETLIQKTPKYIVATLEIPVWSPEGIEGWITGLCGVF